MKQFKKLAVVLMMAGMAVNFAGCGNSKPADAATEQSAEIPEQTTETSEAPSETPQESATAIALSETETAGEGFTIRGPEGWSVTTESGATTMSNEQNESIAAMLVPSQDFTSIDVNEYVSEVQKQLADKASSSGIDMTVTNTETLELPAGDAAVFTIEMPFTEEYLNGWLQSGALTQEQIDAAGGKEQFMADTKMTQIQAHVLTKKGLLTIAGQTLKGADSISDTLKAVAETAILQ